MKKAAVPVAASSVIAVYLDRVQKADGSNTLNVSYWATAEQKLFKTTVAVLRDE